MIENFYAVIMAGGGGTRLWPLSRQGRPKQMLSLFGERTLYQIAVDRLQGIFPAERICVVTIASQVEDLRIQCPQIPDENYIIEPMPRGTASVVGLAAVALQRRDPDAVMAVLTADHYIGNVDGFHQVLRASYDVALDDFLVTLGITPTFPSTGYGYIQVGNKIGEFTSLAAHEALKFKEKPDEKLAQTFIKGNDHVWNSGMFVWHVSQILGEFKRQMPELSVSLSKIAASWGKREQDAVVQQVWEGLKSETIDYGIMEGAKRVAVIPADGLEWSDVGSWKSLYDVLPADVDGNIVREGLHVSLDTQGTLVYGNGDERLIVTIGVENLVVVDTGDVLLICAKDQSQQVKEIVSLLKEQKPKYL